MKIAAASTDGIVVNQHFGRAQQFFIYEITEENGQLVIGDRKKLNAENICKDFQHNEEELRLKAQLLSECQYVLVSRIGPGALAMLENMGIEAYEYPGIIEESIDRLYKQIQIQRLFEK